jgi:UDP-N-acetylglucosamine acyltransferase
LSIHASAIVDKSAQLGQNVEIGPYAVIGPNVRLGDGVKIHPHATIEHTTLGANCEVFPYAVIGLPAQHLRYKGEPARVQVGTGTVFREYVSVHRGTPFDASGTSTTFIGNNCYFMGSSHIAHDCKVGNNVITANSAMLAGHVELGDNAFMSGLAGLHQHVRAGKCVMISGGSMVPFDIAPFCIAQGDRASIRGINVVGMRRMGFDRNAIRLVKDAYRAMFLSALRLEDALKTPELNVDNEAVKIFREFLSVPKRGVLRPPAGMREIETEEASA